jgi:hypothetical protein
VAASASIQTLVSLTLKLILFPQPQVAPSIGSLCKRRDFSLQVDNLGFREGRIGGTGREKERRESFHASFRLRDHSPAVG